MDPKKFYEIPGIFNHESESLSPYSHFSQPENTLSREGPSRVVDAFSIAPESCQEECVISSSLPNQYAKIELDTSVIQKEITPSEVAQEAMLAEESGVRSGGAIRKVIGSNIGYDAWEAVLADDPTSIVNAQDSTLDPTEEEKLKSAENKLIFTNPNFVFLIFCMLMVAHSSSCIGFFSVVLPIWEKAYGFSSVFGGVMNMFLNIFICVTGVWLGMRKFKSPLFPISVGAFIMFLGCILITIPTFISQASFNATHHQAGGLCNLGSYGDMASLGESACDGAELQQNHENSFYVSQARWIFFSSFALIGLGSASLFTLIPSIIDKVMHPEQTSVYFALYYLVSLSSVAVSYVLANFILSSVAENPHTEDESILAFAGNTDHRISTGEERWWILYLISAGFSLISGIAGMYAHKYFRNPKYLSYQVASVTNVFDSTTLFDCERSANRHKQADTNISSKMGCSCWDCTGRLYEQAKYTLENLRKMCTNKSFVMISIANMLIQKLVTAHSIYLPKYMHFKFDISVERAGMMLGAALIIGGSTGSILGGLALKYRRLEKRNILKFLGAICLVSCIFICSFYISCSSPNSIKTGNATTSIASIILKEDSRDECSRNCSCNAKEYYPVCFLDQNYTLPSPCVAGCKSLKIKDKVPIYSGCQCVVSQKEVEVSVGACQSLACKEIYLFITLLMFFNTLIFMTYVPMTKATLRSLLPSDSPSLAFGIQQVLQRLVGQTLGPLILAKMMDMSCSYWKTGDCMSDASNCLKYNETSLSHKMFIFSVTLMILGFLSLILANLWSNDRDGYKRLYSTTVEDEIRV